MTCQLEELHLKGFMSIEDTSLALGPLNVLIGANGSGKSNLLGFFQMLQRHVTGSLPLFVGEAGGASVLLHRGAERTPAIWYKLVLRTDGRPCTFRSHLRLAAGDTLIVLDEDIRGPSEQGGQQVEIRSGTPGGTESVIRANAESKLAQRLQHCLSGWRPYHFHDTSTSARLRATSDLQDDLFLKEDGGNLPAFLFMLRETAQEHFRQIQDTVRVAAPFFRDFVLEPSGRNKDRILLRWRDRWSPDPFSVSQLSDGTLRFICLATLLLQPDPPGLILIDEPELGLHPAAITLLASLLRAASNKSQVLVTTQSVNLLDQFEAGEVLVIDRIDGSSVCRQLEQEALREWLEDYTLGELWVKNVLGGKP